MGIKNLLEKAKEYEVPANTPSLRIKIVGVGGAGNNTLSRLNKMGLEIAETIAINTDARVLSSVPAIKKLLIGKKLTKGLGTGGDPDVGERAALDSYEDIEKAIGHPHLVFLTGGMGGGTAGGSLPIIAEIAKKTGALTVGIVTVPFSAEKGRANRAREGIRRLKEVADSVIVLENDKLLDIIPNVPLEDALRVMDVLIADVIKNLTETLIETSMINIDFADFKRVMAESGDATVLYGESSSMDPEPLIKDMFSNNFLEADISTARAALIHLTVGASFSPSVGTFGKIMEGLTRTMAPDVNIIMGIRQDKEFDGRIKAFMVVTGIRKDMIGDLEGSHVAQTLYP
jgi:cell division protein FtsZ